MLSNNPEKNIWVYQVGRKSTINGMSPTSSQTTNINTLTNSNVIYKNLKLFPVTKNQAYNYIDEY